MSEKKGIIGLFGNKGEGQTPLNGQLPEDLILRELYPAPR